MNRIYYLFTQYHIVDQNSKSSEKYIQYIVCIAIA